MNYVVTASCIVYLVFQNIINKWLECLYLFTTSDFTSNKVSSSWSVEGDSDSDSESESERNDEEVNWSEVKGIFMCSRIFGPLWILHQLSFNANNF